jgi:uncharacterized protein
MPTRLDIPIAPAVLPSGMRISDQGGSVSLASFSPPLKVKLLVLQGTPFCNIDCGYCYLPDRDSPHRMSPTVMEATIRNIVDSGLLGDNLCIAWHAGEPLVAGTAFYRRAFACIDSVIDGRCPVHHSIQTNAMLIDEEWCALFAEHRVRVGVSIDGPAEIHDRYRKTRDGKGTHAKAMRGVEQLRSKGVPFHGIAVVTASSLPYADEIFAFFLNAGFSDVGFNIDECEGEHRSSTICPEQERGFETFLRRMLELSQTWGGRLRIREFDQARRMIVEGLDPVHVSARRYPHNAQVLPLEILAVDHAGNFSTFSPELLGQPQSEYADFVFGNVLSDKLACVFSNPRFQNTYRQIVVGLERCRRECEYFELCGGGAPANKLYETGAFGSAETAYCRNVVRTPIRLMLAHLEDSLHRDVVHISPSRFLEANDG